MGLDGFRSLSISSLNTLREVRAHILLKVEVGKLGISKIAKKVLELSIGDDLATIILVLKAVLADVSSDLLSDISASHLNT